MSVIRNIVREVLFEVLRPSTGSFAERRYMEREFRLKGVPAHTFFGRPWKEEANGRSGYAFFFVTNTDFHKIGDLENGELFGVEDTGIDSTYRRLGAGYGRRVTEAAKVLFHHLDKIIGPHGLFAMKSPTDKNSYIIYSTAEGNSEHGGIVGVLYGNGQYFMKFDATDKDWDDDGMGFMQGPEQFMKYIWLKSQKPKETAVTSMSSLEERFSTHLPNKLKVFDDIGGYTLEEKKTTWLVQGAFANYWQIYDEKNQDVGHIDEDGNVGYMDMHRVWQWK